MNESESMKLETFRVHLDGANKVNVVHDPPLELPGHGAAERRAEVTGWAFGVRWGRTGADPAEPDAGSQAKHAAFATLITMMTSNHRGSLFTGRFACTASPNPRAGH